jgi:penicillin-binding protein 1A
VSVPAPRPAPSSGLPGPVQPAGPGAAKARRGGLGLVRVPAALLLLALGALGAYLWITTPSGDDLDRRVAAIGAAAGSAVRPDEVPLILTRAVLAAEDERFFTHHGLDTIGTARAVWDDVTRLCACEGGSTVTQQLAKLVYYPADSRIARKVPVMAVALKIELHHSKADIMAGYLTVVPTGYGLVGARPAACAYFGHDLSSLTVAQAAEIAGLVQAPSADDPRRHPDRAGRRRDYAIARMLDAGFIDEAQAKAALAEPLLSGSGGCARRNGP